MFTGVSKDELMARALRAYWTAARKTGQAQNGNTDQPSSTLSCIEEARGKQYAVLRNGYRVLAVYRVRNDGMLKRLRRWPAGLEMPGLETGGLR
jgi:hypothetical protein